MPKLKGTRPDWDGNWRAIGRLRSKGDRPRDEGKC